MSKKTIIACLSIAVALAVVFANMGPSGPPRAAAATPAAGLGVAAPMAAPVANGPQGVSPMAIQRGLGAIVAAVRPAVVSISAHPNMVRHQVRPGMQLIDPFPTTGAWIGSGVIVDPRGYVLTSSQAAGNADIAQVTMFRGGHNAFTAERVATDPQTDLVLLKLPFGGNVAWAPLGDSSRVRTGDIVVAMGSPFGLAETVTMGIVSANRRTLAVEGRVFTDVIQTDASINQGNCGGPLVDVHGQVVGINMALYSTDSTFSGIGFAIASNRARAFCERALAGAR